jgi:hypothetical protein
MGKRKCDEVSAEDAREEAATQDPKTSTLNEDQAKLLGFFLNYHMEERTGMTFEVVAAGDLDCHKSNNRWRGVWKSLKEQGLIQPAAAGKGFEITEKGIQQAETPEYKAFMKDKNYVAATNNEYQERLKSKFKCKKSAAIFDLLLHHGSLSRFELAGLVGEKDRSHSFSYSLQELVQKSKVVEPDPSSKGRPKKFRLSATAFLKPDDRPEPRELDREVLAKAVEDNCTPRGGRKEKRLKKKTELDETDGGAEGAKNKQQNGSGQNKAANDDEADESAAIKEVESESQTKQTT